MLTRLNPSRAMRQFVIVAAAAVITWIIPLIIDRVWQLAKIPWIYCGLGLALLSAVCLLGNTSYGAQLSISIGGFSFQPSEFVKISFVFFVATMFYRSTDFKTIAVTTAAAAAHVLVLAASRDLGNALIYFVSYLMMLFVATSNWFYLGAGAAGGAGAAVAAYHMFSHVRRRSRPGGIPGPTWMTSDTRRPSPCLPSVQADGSAWDFTRECRKRSRWWIRTLFFQQFLRSWAGSMPFVFYLSAWAAFSSSC